MARSTVNAAALRELVHALTAAPAHQAIGVPASIGDEVLSWLKELIPSDNVVFHDYAWRQWPESVYTDTAGTGSDRPDEAEIDAIFNRHYWTSYLSAPDRAGDYESVVILTDLCTLHEWRTCPIVVDFRVTSEGDCFFDRDLRIPLPGRPGHSRRIRFERVSGRDFDDTDRAVAILVRPLLVEYLHALDLVSQGIAPLTVRQRQLMSLVADGFSNVQVARTLGITAATVRTHLQKIYVRLGVSSRGEATARVRWSDGRAMLRAVDRDAG